MSGRVLSKAWERHRQGSVEQSQLTPTRETRINLEQTRSEVVLVSPLYKPVTVNIPPPNSPTSPPNIRVTTVRTESQQVPIEQQREALHAVLNNHTEDLNYCPTVLEQVIQGENIQTAVSNVRQARSIDAYLATISSSSSATATSSNSTSNSNRQGRYYITDDEVRELADCADRVRERANINAQVTRNQQNFNSQFGSLIDIPEQQAIFQSLEQHMEERRNRRAHPSQYSDPTEWETLESNRTPDPTVTEFSEESYSSTEVTISDDSVDSYSNPPNSPNSTRCPSDSEPEDSETD